MPLNIDIRQILMHMLNFVILFGGMYFILYSPVKKFMAARDEKYKKAHDEAANKLAEAEEIKKEYEKKLSETDAEIAEKMKNSQAQAEAMAEKCRKEAEKEAEEIVASARKRAENERKDIIDSAKKEISEIAVAAAEKIVFEDADSSYESFLNGVNDDDGKN